MFWTFGEVILPCFFTVLTFLCWYLCIWWDGDFPTFMWGPS
jgi:hypothetical protein